MMTATPPAKGDRVSWTAFSVKVRGPVRMTGTVRHVRASGADPLCSLVLDDPDHVRNADTYTVRTSDLTVEPALPTTAEELAAAIAALGPMEPIERARHAKVLAEAAPVILRGVRREAVYDATRGATHAAVAHDLGVTPAAIKQTIFEYRKARGEVGTR